MSEASDNEPAEQPEPQPDAAAPQPERSGSRPRPSRLASLVAVAAVALALAAIGFSAWVWLHPRREGINPATDQQVADAKTRACAAFDVVRNAVSLQTHADPGADPVATQAAEANARLSMLGGALYLQGHLDPATPPSLAASMRKFTDQLQDLAMNALAGMPNDDPTQAGRLHEGDETSQGLVEACK